MKSVFGLSDELAAMLSHAETGHWQAALLLTCASSPDGWPGRNQIAVIDSGFAVLQAGLEIRPALFCNGVASNPLQNASRGLAPDLALATLNAIFGGMEVRAPINLSRAGYIQRIEVEAGGRATWSFRSDFAVGSECEPIELGRYARVSFSTAVPRDGSMEVRASQWADALITAWTAKGVFARALAAHLSLPRDP